MTEIWDALPSSLGNRQLGPLVAQTIRNKSAEVEVFNILTCHSVGPGKENSFRGPEEKDRRGGRRRKRRTGPLHRCTHCLPLLRPTPPLLTNEGKCEGAFVLDGRVEGPNGRTDDDGRTKDAKKLQRVVVKNVQQRRRKEGRNNYRSVSSPPLCGPQFHLRPISD